MAQWIKTVDSNRSQFLKSSLEMLLHSIVLSHFNDSALFIQHIRKPMLISLENQLNWGLTEVFFHSNCKSSRCLRIKKQVIGIEQRLDQLLVFYPRKMLSM